MSISNDFITGVTKQVFAVDVIANGLFPCQSDVVRLIRGKKIPWSFNDKFEYRMMLSNTNSGGTVNSQVFRENVSLIRPGTLEFGTYRATYGSVFDGISVDMMMNLETETKEAAFINEYSGRLHSLRNNVAALFKNFAIHGQFGVVHQLRKEILAPNIPAAMNPAANTGITIAPGSYATLAMPINVFNSNFKNGKMLIKTTEARPWGAANVTELYMVLENQNGYMTLFSCGTTATAFEDGQFLEVANNRVGGASVDEFQKWNSGIWTLGDDTPFPGSYDQFTGTGTYTSGANAVVGAMEGLADLFPWYHDPNLATGARLGLDRTYRDQPNRLKYSSEQAGNWVMQNPNERIIDCILRGAFLTKSTVPWADIGIWINPITQQQMGYEEGGDVTVLRDNFTAGPIVYQRGVKSTDYQIGNQVIKDVVEDANLPTDVIVIGPKNDIAYNCWDNTMSQIDDYIQETWGQSVPPPIDQLTLPDSFISSLDIDKRIVIGSPSMRDGGMAQGFTYGSNIIHPSNTVPIAIQEMGALFTEYPYTYTIIKLRYPIVELGKSLEP